MFTEGEIYQYDGYTLVDWINLKTAVGDGTYYNQHQRRNSAVVGVYRKLQSVPPGWSDSL